MAAILFGIGLLSVVISFLMPDRSGSHVIGIYAGIACMIQGGIVAVIETVRDTNKKMLKELIEIKEIIGKTKQ